jgi:hypothetical protein
MEKKSRLKIEKVEKESSNENEKTERNEIMYGYKTKRVKITKKTRKKKKKQKLTARLVVGAHAGRSWSWAAIAFREKGKIKTELLVKSVSSCQSILSVSNPTNALTRAWATSR